MIQQNLINISGQTYRKGNQIGSGGYAVIYQGENIQTNEKVAIRVTNEMTQDEYNIHQILINQKKNFLIDIKGIEYNEQQGRIFIAMELGMQDFHSFIENDEYKQFTNLNKNLVFHQMVSAANELHELKYFHRDLKTENYIIIENSNNKCPKIKLIDFGLCKNLNNQNRFTQNVGTILFMAPEVIISEKYDQTSDIWSLGCIYYEMMTTQSFLQGITYQALTDFLQKISQNEINQKIDQLMQLNVGEKNLLKRMLQKEPSQRLALKDILQQLDNLTKRNFQQFEQKQPLNQSPQNLIQPQQNTKWSPQQVSVVRLQTQIKNGLQEKYQKQLEEDISQLNQQKRDLFQQLKQQQERENEKQNQYEQNKLLEKIKIEHEEMIKQDVEDKEKLKELQIAFDLEIQNRLNQLKIQQNLKFLQEIDSLQQQIKNEYEKKLEENIRKREAEIYIEEKDILERELQDLNNKQLKDEQEKKKQQFETKKNSVVYLVTCYNDLLQKNQKIIIEKQTSLQTFQQINQIQVCLINSKIYDLLQDYEQKQLKANQVKQDLQNINNYNQLNQLNEFENEYEEKINQLTTDSLKNIQQIDQEIQSQFDKLSMNEVKNKQDDLSQLKIINQLKTELELQLSLIQDQLIQMKQLANILLQGSLEYDIIELISKSQNQIELLNQLLLDLNLIQNQFLQMKNLHFLSQQESLEELSNQCKQLENKCQNQKEILNIINQEFQQKEKILLKQNDNRIDEIKDWINLQKENFDSFRQSQNIQSEQIEDLENKIYEIQHLIKKINFQRQQFCFKKQKQTFALIEKKQQEFISQYEKTIQFGEQQRRELQCKQQSNEILKKLQDQKQNFESEIKTLQQRYQNLIVNQKTQILVEQQLAILKQNFENYAQKCKEFENSIQVSIKEDNKLYEYKQYIYQQEQFYQDSDSKFKDLFQQAQTICLKIELSQKQENEKWSSFNDLCQSVLEFKQQSKSCRFSTDISFCEQLSQMEKLLVLLTKYEEHFLKCQQFQNEGQQLHEYLKTEFQLKDQEAKIKNLEKCLELFNKYQQHFNENNNQQISKLQQTTQNQVEFSKAKEQQKGLINQINNIATDHFEQITKFSEKNFKPQKVKIKFYKNTQFYETIYKSYESYKQLISQVDSINSEIQNLYSKENKFDKQFHDAKKEEIDKCIIELGKIKGFLSKFKDNEFQSDKKSFIRLVFLLIVTQFYILKQTIDRQLQHWQQLKQKKGEKGENKTDSQNNQDNVTQTRLEQKQKQYQKEKELYQNFLSLDVLCFCDEQLKLIEDNDNEIKKQDRAIKIINQMKLRGFIKDQEKISKVLMYEKTFPFSKFILFYIIENNTN